MRKLLCLVLMLSIISLILAVTATADNETISTTYMRAPDGTLILDEYPEMDGATEKLAAAEAYVRYLEGKATVSDVMQAYSKYFIAIGDLQALSTTRSEAAFIAEYLNPTSINAASDSVSSMRHYSQETSYYCGPATAQSILARYGVTISQSTLAGTSYLKTDYYAGTPWYVDSTTKYVMANVLNSLSGTSYFTALANPTTAQIKAAAITAISSELHGIAANFYLTPYSTVRPEGYPATTIYHWVAIRAYSNYGSTIYWYDPVYGAASVSWSGNLTSSILSDTADNVASFVNGRGIIW